MCIAVPMCIVEVSSGRALCRRYGAAEGELATIDMALVGDQQPGTWILTFLDCAREVVSAEHAALVGKALDALGLAITLDSANVDHLFPDLAGREPELPEHLKGQLTKRSS